jgi:hypothetical protein
MSDASRVQLIYKAETVFAESPAVNPATKLIRFNSSSMVDKILSVISEEIRSDRQRTDLALVGYDASGDITSEASYALQWFDDSLEAALGGTWASNALKNGTAIRSFLIEQGHLDLTKFIRYFGMTVDKFSLDITYQQIVKFVVTMMGCPKPITGAATATASATIAGTTTPTAATANPPMRAGDLIDFSNVGGSNMELAGVKGRSLKLDIANNLRRRDLVTQYNVDSFGYGVQEITGTIETYFADVLILQQFIDNGLFGIKFKMIDPVITAAANSYVVTLPKLKLTDAPVPVPGVESDCFQTLTFRALLDTGVGYTINVDRAVTT